MEGRLGDKGEWIKKKNQTQTAVWRPPEGKGGWREVEEDNGGTNVDRKRLDFGQGMNTRCNLRMMCYGVVYMKPV